MVARPSDRALVLRIEPAAQSRPEASIARACADCGKTLSPKSKGTTGRCRRCACYAINHDPEFKAKRLAALKRRYEDPAARAAAARDIQAKAKKARQDPAVRERMRQRGLEQIALLWTPEVRARWYATRPGAGKKRHETVMAWCPHEYRDEYRRLRISRKYSAAKSRLIIEAKIRADREAERARIAQMSPFERQMEALNRGAGLTSKLNLSRGYDFTLGGVSELGA